MSFELKVQLWILQALLERKRNSSPAPSQTPRA